MTLAQAIRTSRVRGRTVADRQITRPDLSVHPRHFRGRHHAATILVVVILAVFGFRFFPGKDVTVLSNGEALRVSAVFDPRGEGLAAADVQLGPGDQVLYATSGRQSSVAVLRARPIVAEVDGRQLTFRTRASTVGGALAEAGLDLRPGDRVSVDGHLTRESGPLAGRSTFAARSVPGVQASGELGAEGVRITVERARPVVVYVDTLRLEAMSAASNVQGLLADLGMTVREGDLVHPSLDSPLNAGMTVRLEKARTITVVLDGIEQSLYTQASTVAEVLRLLGVDPGPDELLSAPREAPVFNGMSITIGLNRTETVEEEEAIVPGAISEEDPSLARGDVKIIPGTNGLRVKKYAVTFKNGVETGRSFLGSEVRQPAIPARQIVGTRVAAGAKPVLSTPSYTGSYTRKMTVRTTWYNAASSGRPAGDPHYGVTASGIMVDYGICAVDPTVIPWMSRFYVPGYGTCLAADTGGVIKGDLIDLGFPDSAGDVKWPNSTVEIYFLPD
ncbi:MAG: hypothetical protein C0506_06825 [Anaerolinea sp.]|nr:hypothetical protein [Anaerolinea sp.]